MKNAERLLLASVRRYAAARGYEIETHGDGWIVEIRRGHRSHVVHGYDIGLNTASSHRVANDKAATFEILNGAGIPAVPHRLFMHPRFLAFMTAEGNWRDMLDTFDAFGRDIVIKDNEGTGGMEMARVSSPAALEQAAHRLFDICRGVVLSPFLAIDTETRFVFLDADCVLAYRKERPGVTGDGRSTLAELVIRDIAAGRLDPLAVDLDAIDRQRVPASSQWVAVQWKHNLGQGAQAVRLDPGAAQLSASLALARRAFDRLGLRFASIDLVRSAGRDLVLEANSGVMLEEMARGVANGEMLADGIYHRALDLAIGAKH